MTNDVTFSKLHSGDWGVSGPVDMIETGNVVTVTKKSGATARVTIKSVIWDNGETAIASISRNQSVTKPNAPQAEPLPDKTAWEKPKGPNPDKPEPGKIYRLTGDSRTPSVMRGDPLADCEVASESAVELATQAAFDAPVTPSEPASEALNGWGVCKECGVPGIRDVNGLGLSCECAF